MNSRDLDALAGALSSSRFEKSECHRRLAALAAAETLPRNAHEALEKVRGPVQAMGAARRAEGRDAEAIRRVLDALGEQHVGRSDVYCSQIFRALFGAPGRNSYFSVPESISHSLPSTLRADARWHELVVALETGDVDAQHAVASHLSPHDSVPECEGPHWWSLTKKVARLDGKPLSAQVRWILESFTLRARRARRAARGLAAELGVDVPQQDASQDYSVAAAVALVARLPVGFPEWNELFELMMLELKAAHVGSTISEALGVIPWEVVADERKNDEVTLRRSFRGYEVRWTTRLVRFREVNPERYDDFKGRLSCKPRLRAISPGVRWTSLLNATERETCASMVVEFGDVAWLADLLAEGVTLTERHVDAHVNPLQLRAMAPHLSPALRERALDRLDGRATMLSAQPVLALLDHIVPSQRHLAQFARQGMTELFEAIGKLPEDVRLACLVAAESAHREGTAAVLRDGPPAPVHVERIAIQLVTVTPPAIPKKAKRVASLSLPIDTALSPSGIVVTDTRIHVSAATDIAFEWNGSVWAPRTLGFATTRLVRGEDFSVCKRGEIWMMFSDGQDPRELVGDGAADPIWKDKPAVWVAAKGSLVVATSFRCGARVFNVSAGALSKGIRLCEDKAFVAATDGTTVLVRRPSTLEVYASDGKNGWRRTHESRCGGDGGFGVWGDRFAMCDTSMETKHGRGAVVLYRGVNEQWEREREIISPKPKVKSFGRKVGLAGNALVIEAFEQRWLFSDASSDASFALPVAQESVWALHPKWLVDAHRGKQKGASLALTVYALSVTP